MDNYKYLQGGERQRLVYLHRDVQCVDDFSRWQTTAAPPHLLRTHALRSSWLPIHGAERGQPPNPRSLEGRKINVQIDQMHAVKK